MGVTEERPKPGDVEAAVLRDLRAWKLPAAPSRRGALAELALTLARALDAKPPVTVAAKLAMELRVQLGQLRELASERASAAGAQGNVSTPVWHEAEPGAADVGAERGGGGPPAGQAVDAASAEHS